MLVEKCSTSRHIPARPSCMKTDFCTRFHESKQTLWKFLSTCKYGHCRLDSRVLQDLYVGGAEISRLRADSEVWYHDI